VGIVAAVLIAMRPHIARNDDMDEPFDHRSADLDENVEQNLHEPFDHEIEMGTARIAVKCRQES
jgi:hypothetical protein